MKYLCLLLVCCLTGIRQTSAACSTATMVSFTESTFVGVWYEVGTTTQSTYSCMKYNFTAGSGPLSYQLTRAIYSKNSFTSTTSFGTWTPVSGSVGKYNDKFPATATTGTDVTVVATDYTSYAVGYSCLTVGTGTVDVYRLFSRTPNSFTAAKTSAGTAIPTTVTMYPINNNCPTGTIKDLFLFGRR